MHARWQAGDCSGETEKAGKRESATEYFRLVEGEGFCCSLYKQPLMNRIVVIYQWELLILALTPSNNLDVSVHATSV